MAALGRLTLPWAAILSALLIPSAPAATLPLLARRPHAFAGAQLSARADRACVPLKNQGTHFTVDVEVGTPPQLFSVVADTGSNSLIVPSCICEQAGKCKRSDRCFTGTNRSSTFQMYMQGGYPVEVLLTFGSGQVEAVIAKDTVSVGGLRTFMEDGLLLMVDNALQISGPFEGILGLGLPQSEEKESSGSSDSASAEEPLRATEGDARTTGISKQDIERIVRAIAEDLQGAPADGEEADPLGGGGRGAATPIDYHSVSFLGPLLQESERRELPAPVPPPLAHARVPHAKGFLEQAHVPRFSMCFNDGANGVLRLGTPPVPSALEAVGHAHWGLDFRGISVGDVHAAPLFCTPEEMKKGQETACGAIPDSGTTMIMAPPAQLATLLEAICDGWPRCASNFTALQEAASAAKAAAAKVYGFSPWSFKAATKAKVVEFLLEDCQSWLPTSKAGLGELPPLHFHVGGTGGAKVQHLEMTGVDYVFEQVVEAEPEEEAGEPEQGASLLQEAPRRARAGPPPTKVCAAAFSTMDYPTTKNGPVWILGLPLFYAYTVAYDAQAVPPTVAFTSVQEVPCGGCGNQVGLVLTNRTVEAAGAERARKLHTPRRIQGPFRAPSIDVSQPL